MYQVLITTGPGTIDYTRYVLSGSLSINAKLNQPTITQFAIANVDPAFTVPLKGAYVQIYSTLYRKYVATGVISAIPEPSFTGRNARLGGFIITYQITVTSDEYVLNNKPTPFIPAFVNSTQGQILSTIANALAPGVFDTTTYVASGDIVPYYQYDPKQSWSDIAKTFGDQARYRYNVINRVLYYQPYGDAPLSITYDETGQTTKIGVNPQATFDSSGLQVSLVQVPLVNDVIVVGAAEPGAHVKNVFIGDGFSSSFPLSHEPFHTETETLLLEDWTSTSIDASKWTVVDPQNNLQPFQSALNVLGGLGSYNTTTIVGNSGLELGGSIYLQHGQVQSTGAGEGLIGGVYSSSLLLPGNCLFGFQASGAGAQTTIQPFANGAVFGSPLLMDQTHSYVLANVVVSSQVHRYNRQWRTVSSDRLVFGGDSLAASSVTVTWQIFDYAPVVNISTGVTQYTAPVLTTYSQTFASMPSFGIYAPVNSRSLKIVMTSTLLAMPCQASLFETPLTGSGANVKVSEPLGFGMANQVATITKQGNAGASLEFYLDTIPPAQTLVEVNYRKTQLAVARVRDSASVATQSAILGDDGVRGAIVSNLSPAPRNSAECGLAGAALIRDAELPIYQGSYQAKNYYWDSSRDYPLPGRYLYLAAPSRGIKTPVMVLVREVEIKVEELTNEVVTFVLGFGQDKYIDRTIQRFLQPPNVYRPQDTALAPTPQELQFIETTYLPDLDNVQVTQVDSNFVTLDLGSSSVVEVRQSDLAWGTGPGPNLLMSTAGGTALLNRVSHKDTYYLRQTTGASGLFSRNSAIVQVSAPLTPSAPSLALFWSGQVAVPASPQVAFASDPTHPIVAITLNGFISDVYGVEIRAADNITVLYRRVYSSTSDLVYTYDNTVALARSLTFYAYTFNLFGTYSAAAQITSMLSVPVAPVLGLVEQSVGGVSVLLDQEIDLVFPQHPIQNVTVQAATGTDFSAVEFSTTVPGQPSAVSIQLPVKLFYARAKRNDYLGDSPWSATITMDQTGLPLTANPENIAPPNSFNFSSATPFSASGGSVVQTALFRAYIPPSGALGSFITSTGLPGDPSRLAPGQYFTWLVSLMQASGNLFPGTPVLVNFLSASGGTNFFSASFGAAASGSWAAVSVYIVTDPQSLPSYGWQIINNSPYPIYVTAYAVNRGRVGFVPVPPVSDGGSASGTNVPTGGSGGQGVYVPPGHGGGGGGAKYN